MKLEDSGIAGSDNANDGSDQDEIEEDNNWVNLF